VPLEPYLAFGNGQRALCSSSLQTNTPSATGVNNALSICSGTAVKWPQIGLSLRGINARHERQTRPYSANVPYLCGIYKGDRRDSNPRPPGPQSADIGF